MYVLSKNKKNKQPKGNDRPPESKEVQSLVKRIDWVFNIYMDMAAVLVM